MSAPFSKGGRSVVTDTPRPLRLSTRPSCGYTELNLSCHSVGLDAAGFPQKRSTQRAPRGRGNTEYQQEESCVWAVNSCQLHLHSSAPAHPPSPPAPSNSQACMQIWQSLEATAHLCLWRNDPGQHPVPLSHRCESRPNTSTYFIGL